MALRVTANSLSKKIVAAIVTANQGTDAGSFAAGNDSRFTTPAPASATTAALAAVGNAINTSSKSVGRMVFNTTTSKPVWAAGADANSVWVDATGATAHTPV